ncbi:50S ribosomal protein L25/general stress protein Ctc [Sandaracinobacter sp. RS1-74]|uniref:50S ribosomal protein L25/general stress protein Ctc n=1 Tax=Sandaracinobacteroides sayramensis TaxID=2913411 RepID=UPI001EDA6131|nr:50S ribosomal protein L25/general stress protein Ctc [Sandaracinobacteroides sayramensis]MCG2840325.1 50S ribosomal protein L25/general stress protein Ctc [Sandaracinobacteroides sayramensis]
MSDVLTLAAEARDRAGKGASRAMRREGRVPAVIYGNKEAPLSIHVEEKRLVKLLQTGFFTNSTVEIELDGQKYLTLPRDVQFHPVNDRPIHVDFLRVGANTLVEVNVPVRFENEAASPGLKRGGVLNVVRHEVELKCPANAIPDYIVVDVTGFDVGDSIHISAVKLPKDVTPVIDDRDFTIATIAAPSGLKSQEAAEGEAAEG